MARQKHEPNVIDQGYRIAGTLYLPGGGVTQFIEQVVKAVGYGRWVWCKYCDSYQRPAISFPTAEWRLQNAEPLTEQLICATCGYALAPPVLAEDVEALRQRPGPIRFEDLDDAHYPGGRLCSMRKDAI